MTAAPTSGRVHRVTRPTPTLRLAAARGWRLDTDNGSMAPRSALDVLVDLNERVTTGHLAEYQPVPLGSRRSTRPSAPGCVPASCC